MSEASRGARRPSPRPPLTVAERELAERLARGRANLADVEAAGSTWLDFRWRMAHHGIEPHEMPGFEIVYGWGQRIVPEWIETTLKWHGSQDRSRWLTPPLPGGFGQQCVGLDVERDGDAWTWRIWETPRADWYPEPSGETCIVEWGEAADRDSAITAVEARAIARAKERFVALRRQGDRRGALVRDTGVPVRALLSAIAADPAVADVARRVGVDPADARTLLMQAAQAADDSAPEAELFPWEKGVA